MLLLLFRLVDEFKGKDYRNIDDGDDDDIEEC